MEEVSLKFSGLYRSLKVHGSAEEGARAFINFVNIQGATSTTVTPTCMCSMINNALDRLDPALSWRKWWFRSSGQFPVLQEAIASRQKLPTHRLPHEMSDTGWCLGINVGGHFMRLVWLLNGDVHDTKVIRLGTGKESLLFGASITDFLNLLELHCQSRKFECIGIAWSAPRTILGLRSMSIQMEGAGEIGELLHKGQIDTLLSKLCGCPVLSWNDGEAVAAAERMARLNVIKRPLLVLKLGTSIATGLATPEGICALPLQLAKCLLSVRPLKEYKHPVVGLEGTARDLIGADSVAQTYQSLSSSSTPDYLAFCQAAVKRDDLAIQIVKRAAMGISELSTLIGGMWSPVDLVITGKNLENNSFRTVFVSHVREQLAIDTTLCDAACDVDMCAAIGAVILSVGKIQT